MEGWQQWQLGREKKCVQRKNKRIHLTPTGLLMEGHSSQNPCSEHFECNRDVSTVRGKLQHNRESWVVSLTMEYRLLLWRMNVLGVMIRA